MNAATRVLLPGLVLATFVSATAPTAFMIDQGGNNGAGFPFPDLVRWGVKQVTGGSIDCTSLLNAIPGGPWYNASGLAYVAQQVSEAQAQLAAAHAAGLKIYFTSDIFEVPTLLFKRYAQNLTWPNSTCFGYTIGPTCIDLRSNFTQDVLRALFSELVETFPTVDGLVLRYGENSPCKVRPLGKGGVRCADVPHLPGCRTRSTMRATRPTTRPTPCRLCRRVVLPRRAAQAILSCTAPRPHPTRSSSSTFCARSSV